MAPATQRLRGDEKRSNRVQVRLSDSELAELRERAAARGMAVAAFLASPALSVGDVPVVPRAVLLSELMGVRRSLVLVVGGWSEPPPPEVLDRIEELIRQVDSVGGPGS